jgi:hypothetical protein
LIEHVWPFSRFPQVPVVTPLLVDNTHSIPGAQSLFDAQDELHVPLAQRKGAHATTPAGLQLPLPSQVRASFFAVELVQLDSAQIVLAGYFAQLPKPSHRPELPQVDFGTPLQSASGSPAPI